jgi:AraC family transcriptional regulator of adaptative response/methylated-DNA-[protein]-cysteine methyltransferase
MVSRATFTTPLGPGEVVVEGGRLLEVRLPPVAGDASAEEPAAAGTQARGVPEGGGTLSSARADDSSVEALRWASDLASYFQGERQGWTEDEIDLAAYGFTPFRLAVYRALLAVPAGSTVTYGELAATAGRPGAARAVGTAMAANPIAIVVPCHRVVRNDGSIGHYGFGDAWKPLLLRHEGALP